MTREIPKALKEIYRTALKDKIPIESVKVDDETYYVWTRGKDKYDTLWAVLGADGTELLEKRIDRISWTIHERIGLGIVNPRSILNVRPILQINLEEETKYGVD